MIFTQIKDLARPSLQQESPDGGSFIYVQLLGPQGTRAKRVEILIYIYLRQESIHLDNFEVQNPCVTNLQHMIYTIQFNTTYNVQKPFLGRI